MGMLSQNIWKETNITSLVCPNLSIICTVSGSVIDYFVIAVQPYDATTHN
jgi:hypothetical protein